MSFKGEERISGTVCNAHKLQNILLESEALRRAFVLVIPKFEVSYRQAVSRHPTCSHILTSPASSNRPAAARYGKVSLASAARGVRDTGPAP